MIKDARHYAGAIVTTMPCRMSVANVLEAFIVVESRGGAAAGHELDVFLERAGIELMPVTIEHLAAVGVPGAASAKAIIRRH